MKLVGGLKPGPVPVELAKGFALDIRMAVTLKARSASEGNRD